MSLQRNIATGYDFFNGLLGRIEPIRTDVRVEGVREDGEEFCEHWSGKPHVVDDDAIDDRRLLIDFGCKGPATLRFLCRLR